MKYIYVITNPLFDVREEKVFKIGWSSDKESVFCSGQSMVVFSLGHESADDIFELLKSDLEEYCHSNNKQMVTCALDVIERNVKYLVELYDTTHEDTCSEASFSSN